MAAVYDGWGSQKTQSFIAGTFKFINKGNNAALEKTKTFSGSLIKFSLF